MRVDERMRGPVAIDPDGSLLRAEQVMATYGLRHLPVARGSSLVGLVDEITLAAAHPSPATTLTTAEVAGRLATIPVTRIMHRDPLTVAPTTPVEEAARLMSEHDLSVLPVVRQGALVGMLVDRDILTMLATPR
jgi:acetoin utilization protein AcuB